MYSTHRITLPKVPSIPSHSSLPSQYSLPRVPSILEYLVYPVSLPSQSTHIVQPTQSVHLVYPVTLPSQFSLPSIVSLPSQYTYSTQSVQSTHTLTLPIHLFCPYTSLYPFSILILPIEYTHYTLHYTILSYSQSKMNFHLGIDLEV